MNEASAVVAQYQMERLTDGRLRVDDLKAETAMALTLFEFSGWASSPMMKHSTFQILEYQP